MIPSVISDGLIGAVRREYAVDPSRRHPLRLFVRGDPYELWGVIPSDVHLIGTDGGPVFLLGADRLGRDVLSRVIYGARISLSIPTIPLWMALSAALPPKWPPVRVFFVITVILAIAGWASLARVVRGKLLELREADFVLAGRIAGHADGAIITRHLLPSFMSYLIVSVTLSIPGMILGETALSFLGLGLRAPVVSWGVLLQDAQNFRAVAIHPWLLFPALAVIVTVLMFNFLGDGLRDAADPYKR